MFWQEKSEKSLELEHPQMFEIDSKQLEQICQIKACMLAVGLHFNILKETLAPSLISKNLLDLVKMCRRGPWGELKRDWFTVLICSPTDRFSSNKELNLKFTQVSVHLNFEKLRNMSSLKVSITDFMVPKRFQAAHRIAQNNGMLNWSEFSKTGPQKNRYAVSVSWLTCCKWTSNLGLCPLNLD